MVRDGSRGFKRTSGILRQRHALQGKSKQRLYVCGKWTSSHTCEMATLPKDVLAAAVAKANKAVEEHKERGGDDEFTNAVGLGAALEAFKESEVVKKWISEVL